MMIAVMLPTLAGFRLVPVWKTCVKAVCRLGGGKAPSQDSAETFFLRNELPGGCTPKMNEA